MIKRLFFKFGPSGSDSSLIFEPSAMTVFVGPNNSGKSLVLRELQNYAEQGRTADRKILEGIELVLFSEAETTSLIAGRKSPVPATETIPEGHVRVARPVPASGSASHLTLNVDHLIQQFSNLQQQQSRGDQNWWQTCWNGIYQHFTSLFTVALDGKTRLSLTEPRPAGDLLASPVNHLASLFQNDVARKRVRSITHEAFGLYFVVDPTNPGQLRIRMSHRQPLDDQEEQALDARARHFHTSSRDIAELSDGVKAFTGLISALISSDYKIMLVDEPEAFLHPPLAGQLGREMATLADERLGNVFASTHSSRFLMGCIESGKPTNIVRLTYQEPHATARLLPAERIQELMRDPLLRSAGVLEALFYSGAVVCEADKDRVFYAEVNNRLNAAGKKYVADAIFLNAQNKQTVRRIVGPMREMGLPAAAVVDLDVIKGDDLRDLLRDCFVPTELIQSLGQLRGQIESRFREAGLNMKEGGITLLPPAAQEACRSLLDQLAIYGIFVVSLGEVESWLSYLGLQSSKENWLPEIFNRMKANPQDSQYVSPRKDDVWLFLEKIASWIASEDRCGMPR